MSEGGIFAEFIEGARGRIFVVLRRPPRVQSGRAVLVVPAFAEEMNKSRRMLTETARGLAAQGIATVVPDLYGTGDSEGEFAEGTLEVWLEDLARTARWAAAAGWPIDGLLCVRFGALLGARLARQSVPGVTRTVFWQAMTDGERFAGQFLRLRVAASMMQPGGGDSLASLRAELAAGRNLEIAGYELSPTLARELATTTLAAEVSAALGALHWMEVARDADSPLPATSRDCMEKCRSVPLPVTLHRHIGEPFWTSTEIVVNTALVEDTVRALAAPASH